MKNCTYCGKEYPDEATICEIDGQPLPGFVPPPPEINIGNPTSSPSRYASFWPRFCAGFIDGVVFIPLSFIDGFLSAPERGPVIVVIWNIIFYSAYWLYSVILHARCGQTLGKMALRIKVLDVSEERIPTFRQAFLRDIGYIVLNNVSLGYLVWLVLTGKYLPGVEISSTPGLILTCAGLGWFLLEVATMLTNKKRRALHDFIAGTVVIRDV